MKRVGFAAGLGTLAGTTPVVVQVQRDAIADSRSSDLPIGTDQGGFLDRVEVNYSGLPAAPATIEGSCSLTWDAAGDEGASNQIEQDIVRGRTTTTDGTAVFSIAGDFPMRDGATPGTIFVWLFTDNAPAVPAVVVRLYYRDEVN